MRMLAKIRLVINRAISGTGFQFERSNINLPFDFPVDKNLLKGKYQDRITRDFIIRFSPYCDALIDVGANRGTFTDLFVQINGNFPKYLFEPLPELFDYLEAKYKFEDGYYLYNSAISNAESYSVFHKAANDGQSSSLLKIGERHKKAAPHALEVDQLRVKVSTLDLLLDETKFNNAFLKIDVQGSELQALEGALNTLKRTAAIHIEVSIQSLYDGDTIGYKIWELLVAHNFTLYGMDPWFRDKNANGELLQCDFFFIKNHLLKKYDY